MIKKKKLLNKKIPNGSHPYIEFKNVRMRTSALKEAVSMQRRRQLKQQFKRIARKLEVARKRSQGRFAPEDRLALRTLKQARAIIRKRLAGRRGQNYKDLNIAGKEAVDELLDTNSNKLSQIRKLIAPLVKRNEASRLRKTKKGKLRSGVKKTDLGLKGKKLSENLNEGNQYKVTRQSSNQSLAKLAKRNDNIGAQARNEIDRRKKATPKTISKRKASKYIESAISGTAKHSSKELTIIANTAKKSSPKTIARALKNVAAKREAEENRLQSIEKSTLADAKKMDAAVKRNYIPNHTIITPKKQSINKFAEYKKTNPGLFKKLMATLSQRLSQKITNIFDLDDVKKNKKLEWEQKIEAARAWRQSQDAEAEKIRTNTNKEVNIKNAKHDAKMLKKAADVKRQTTEIAFEKNKKHRLNNTFHKQR